MVVIQRPFGIAIYVCETPNSQGLDPARDLLQLSLLDLDLVLSHHLFTQSSASTLTVVLFSLPTGDIHTIQYLPELVPFDGMFTLL